jgi:predicted transcriptional regulator of viral defense system
MSNPKAKSELHKRLTRLSKAKQQGRGATVIRMAREGLLRKLRPGVYRPADREVWLNQDLLDACAAVPDGVICLVSALAYYGLTTTIPNAVWIAIRRDAWVPRLTFPARFVRMGERSLEMGVETIRLEGQRIKIYGKAKTVCDALRFRDKMGVEVALEALKTFLRQGGLPDDLIRWETTCRVQGILRPYLEAMLA